ncbi:MAG TPA: hypothetical protein PLD20_01790 [Blastocatellia bacterium]|nr:hypothetical protein [Blastocatellia bacterium]HMZ16668.1 hypothetical protein [Blastocatellia bacterium]HNG33881.1 hypothetical protein [Blastocatellia bacterium]
MNVKSVKDIVGFIALRIGEVYFRPLMYGGNAIGVDALLHGYHEVWAEAFDYRKTLQLALDNLPILTALNDETLTEDEKAALVVERWRLISRQIGIPVPYKQLRESFKENERLRNKFPEEK